MDLGLNDCLRESVPITQYWLQGYVVIWVIRIYGRYNIRVCPKVTGKI